MVREAQTAMTLLTCPTCGIVVEVVSEPGGTRCSYDLTPWLRACRDAALGSPLLCSSIGAALAVATPTRRHPD
jgi:hypothetical protein